jgi:hypothetical protein
MREDINKELPSSNLLPSSQKELTGEPWRKALIEYCLICVAGYNDRGVVEYIERTESDDDYDEVLLTFFLSTF